MAKRKRLGSLLVAVLTAALTALVAGATPISAEQVTLGGSGVLYTARVGRYGELFPAGSEHARDTNVLALEIQDKDAAPRLVLVPGGEGIAPDAVPFVQWEDASRRLFIVWEGLSRIHSGVHLVSLHGAEWSQPLEISGSPFTTKSSPQLAVTRETYSTITSSGETVEAMRTILHTVWFEDDYGDVDVLYAPVVLDNGAEPELSPPLFNLGSFVSDSGPAGNEPTSALLRSPRIVAGADAQSVLIGFSDDATDRMVTLRLEVLPVELSALAGELAGFLENQADSCKGDVKKLAERARAHLVVIGTRFSAYARSYMADALREWLLAHRAEACSQGGVTSLSGRARAHLVVIGRTTLRQVILPTDDRTSSYMLSIDDASRDRRSDLALTVQRATVTPPALAAGLTRIHLAETGRNTLVSWLGAGKLFYQEYDGDAWLPAQSLTLSPDFTLETAYSLLDGRAR